MFGDQGWYSYAPGKYSLNFLEIYFLSMLPSDRDRAEKTPWYGFLEGANPGYPVKALHSALTQLMEGGLYIQHPGWARTSPAQCGALLFARLRYFDPVALRAGVPEGVAALVEKMTAEETHVTLVNVHPTEARAVVVQAGAYGEHQVTTVTAGPQMLAVNSRAFRVNLAAGAGERLTIRTKRFANKPTLNFPWDAA